MFVQKVMFLTCEKLNKINTSCDEHLIMQITVKSLCWTLKTNTILYINYITIKYMHTYKKN